MGFYRGIKQMILGIDKLMDWSPRIHSQSPKNPSPRGFCGVAIA